MSEEDLKLIKLRLTKGFSKKWENLKAMLAIYFAFYTFCQDFIRCANCWLKGERLK